MIKKFKDFITEEISGTELIGPMGPGYGETGLQNKTIDGHDTALIYSEIDGNLYTIDLYNDLYNNYLKSGGSPLQGGFCQENIDIILSQTND